jgi:hypothetical protein
MVMMMMMTMMMMMGWQKHWGIMLVKTWKHNNKPPIGEWFIPFIYGEIEDFIIVLATLKLLYHWVYIGGLYL